MIVLPMWARCYLGALLAGLLAVLVAPLIPAPIGTILYWLLWAIALIAIVLGTRALLGSGPRPPRNPPLA